MNFSYYNLVFYIQQQPINIDTFMNKQPYKKNKKIQKNTKSKKKFNLNQSLVDNQIQSNSILEDQHQQIHQQPNIQTEKFQTPQDLKIRIAKNMIEKLKNNKRKNEDDFFIMENNQKDDFQNGTSKFKQGDDNTYDQEIAQQLKTQHMRKQNKLYESLTDHFHNLFISQPIQYKGHTQCITGVQQTETNLYSCSKDRSIIKWDRQTGKKQFISLGRDLDHHQSDILSLSLHSNQNVLATAGQDTLIKLWDIRTNNLIGTLKGHRNTINGIKFGVNSNILCSISKDLTLKQWDFSQRGLMQTFYQHNNQVLDIDHFNANDFITSGNDHQAIIWKTQKQTKIVFKGHQYAIDRVRSINQERFVTGSMDGSINLWYIKRNKPIFKNHQAHQGWISALDSLKQSNIFASGGTDQTIKIWGIQQQMRGMTKIRQLKMNGIVTDIKLTNKQLIATECDQHRLGRWVTCKTRNKIKIFKFKQNI